jgi:hypothetical protein
LRKQQAMHGSKNDIVCSAFPWDDDDVVVVVVIIIIISHYDAACRNYNY